ncbi:hypothetical protein GWK47_047890 [Chionoecetes opilio]|uniref:Uncharacterized protein n=1 Tax=Chionoecetes opilio TaxID=41210 RepID=A0A8J5CVD8_CHIOP|nr:hypothetical protein GWK47_047890 [Chionoecetes opilio]
MGGSGKAKTYLLPQHAWGNKPVKLADHAGQMKLSRKSTEGTLLCKKFFNYEQFITIYIKAHFTDATCAQPFQISKKPTSYVAAYGWGMSHRTLEAPWTSIQRRGPCDGGVLQTPQNPPGPTSLFEPVSLRLTGPPPPGIARGACDILPTRHRRGSPFYARFHQLVGRLRDAGIIAYWTEKEIDRHTEKGTEEPFTYDSSGEYSKDRSKQVVLGLSQLDGAFYVFVLGIGVSFLIFLLEVITG